MTLNQLAAIKQRLAVRREAQPLEYHAWDLVLALWLVGWLGMPAQFLLGQLYGVAACAMLMFAPQLYVALRGRLHQRGRLRCDWLAAAGNA